MFDFKGLDKSIPDSIKASKYFNMNLIENRTHRIGSIKMNITNYGCITSFKPVLNGFTAGPYRDYFLDECTGEQAIAMEMPAGSGEEYLWMAAIWCGGYLESDPVSVNGNECMTFIGPRVSTSHDMFWIMSYEMVPSDFESDPSGKTMGRIKETSSSEGRLNCLFEQVYDPAATAYEQFTTCFSDKSTKQSTWDIFDNSRHMPLGVEIKQTSYAWPYDFAKKFVIVDYTIYNRNKDKKDIYDFFIGNIFDTDVGKIGVGEYEYPGWLDDISGFINKWDGYIDPATGIKKTVDMNMVWSADNDGREYVRDDVYQYYMVNEPGAGSRLDGATGVFTARILRNPNPNLRFSFNLWTANYQTESMDWGPRWKTGYHKDWLYDLTATQKGYDDTNYDSLTTHIWADSTQFIYGGRTEGTPCGDIGRYMVMSNDEFDYNQTAIRDVYLGMENQADGTPIPQAGKWRPWVVTGTEDEGDIADGSIRELNDLANGAEVKFLLSFGPFGFEEYINLATDLDHDGEIDSYIPNKKVWKFAYGDSLKLTLALMVSDNFHTSLEQDPNYRDSTVVDLTDGLDISLFDQGWYDAYFNVVWAERVYDTPLFDTPVTRWGETKKDGWYGEDVGADGLFGNLVGDAYCWWLDLAYPGPDQGEGDFEMTTFTTPMTDIDGFTSTNEDNLLPFGNRSGTGNFGVTGRDLDGEGYGYMVKYDKLDGVFPQGTWVRYGFDNDRLDAGDGVPDFSGPPPPPSPKIKVTELDNEITVEWTSHEFYTKDDGSIGVAGPEHTYDSYTRLYDFEGYHIELSPDRQFGNFTTIFSADFMNYAYQNVADLRITFQTPSSRLRSCVPGELSLHSNFGSEDLQTCAFRGQPRSHAGSSGRRGYVLQLYSLTEPASGLGRDSPIQVRA
jgi:hypothetical protein